MRTSTAPELARMAAQHVNHYGYVEIQDSDGAWRDFATLAGKDFVTGCSLNWNSDNTVASGTLTLRREAGSSSISPLMTGSTINRNGGGTYAPIVDVNRRIRVTTAVTDNGVAPITADRKEIFSGYLGDVGQAGKSDATMSIPFTDIGKLLVITQIDLSREYGSASGTPIETVIQQMFDDNLGAGVVTLYTPTSPGWNLHPYRQDMTNLMDAANALAGQIGYKVQAKYNSVGVMVITFYAPDRTKTTTDATIGPTMYTDAPSLGLADSDIRNNWSVTYTDRTTGTRNTLHSTDTFGSIAKYGKRTAQIAESQTSNIDSATEANKLLVAAYSDTASPRESESTVVPGWWMAELGDLYLFQANGVTYDTDRKRSIVGISMTIQNGHIETTLSSQGQPMGQYRNWLKWIGDVQEPVMATGTVRITAADATSVTVAVDTTISGAQVYLANLMGGAVRTAGPLVNVLSPTGTTWTFTRSAFSTGSGVAIFRIVAPALPSSDIPFPIDEQGRDTVSLALKIDKTGETASNITVRVTSADPYPQGHQNIIITYAVYGTGTVTPTSGQYLGDAADGATRVVTASLNTSGYVDFVIPKPLATAPGGAHVSFTATANARVQAAGSVDIPAKGYITPIPKPVFTEDDTTNIGSVVVTLYDPQSNVTQVRFTAWAGNGTPTITTLTVPTTYSASIGLVDKKSSYIKVELLGTDAAGNTGIVLNTDTYTFNIGVRPILDKPDYIVGADGTVTSIFTGDNDTYQIYSKLYIWNGQSAPTISAADVLATGTISPTPSRKGAYVIAAPTNSGLLIGNRKYTLAQIPVNSAYAAASIPKPFATYGDLVTRDVLWAGVGATPDPAVSFRNITVTDQYADLDVVFGNETQDVYLYLLFDEADPASGSPNNSTALPMPQSVENSTPEDWNYFNRNETVVDGGGVVYKHIRVNFFAGGGYGILTAVAFDAMNQRKTPTAATSIKLHAAGSPPAATPPTPTLVASGTPTSNQLQYTVGNLNGAGGTPVTIRLYLNNAQYKDYTVLAGDITAHTKVILTNADLAVSSSYSGRVTLLSSTIEGASSGTVVQSTIAATGGGGGGTGGNGKVPTPSITASYDLGIPGGHIVITPGSGTPAGTQYQLHIIDLHSGTAIDSPWFTSLTYQDGFYPNLSYNQQHTYTCVAKCTGYTNSDYSAAAVAFIAAGNYPI